MRRDPFTAEQEDFRLLIREFTGQEVVRTRRRHPHGPPLAGTARRSARGAALRAAPL